MSALVNTPKFRITALRSLERLLTCHNAPTVCQTWLYHWYNRLVKEMHLMLTQASFKWIHRQQVKSSSDTLGN